MVLTGKVALITGGSSGIGLASVRLFAERGASLVVVDREQGGCEDLQKESADRGWRLATVAGDIATPTTWVRALEAAAEFGPLDVLVNNAGYGIQGSVLETTTEAWDGIFSTNVTGTFLGCRAVLPQMIESGRGSIVNVASVAGHIGMARRAAYCATKAAVVGLTRAMAVDHSAQGIRVNAVAPGTTDSPYFQKIAADVEDPEAYQAYLAGRQLLNRLADPAEIAEAILFLASDASSFATGSVVTVDGGMSVA